MNAAQGSLFWFISLTALVGGVWIGALLWPNPNLWGIPVLVTAAGGVGMFFSALIHILEVV